MFEDSLGYMILYRIKEKQSQRERGKEKERERILNLYVVLTHIGSELLDLHEYINEDYYL